MSGVRVALHGQALSSKLDNLEVCCLFPHFPSGNHHFVLFFKSLYKFIQTLTRNRVKIDEHL